MSANQPNIAMLRALAGALGDAATEAAGLARTYKDDGAYESCRTVWDSADLLGRLSTACDKAANSLQNDDDALARGVEPREGDPQFNPRGKAPRMSEEIGRG